jgi:transcriptional regulator with XRE-family HTH domain
MAQLRELRNSAGKNQKEVARDLGTSVSTINRHEHGKTPLSDFHRRAYASYYGVSAGSIEQPERVAA